MLTTTPASSQRRTLRLIDHQEASGTPAPKRAGGRRSPSTASALAILSGLVLATTTLIPQSAPAAMRDAKARVVSQIKGTLLKDPTQRPGHSVTRLRIAAECLNHRQRNLGKQLDPGTTIEAWLPTSSQEVGQKTSPEQSSKTRVRKRVRASTAETDKPTDRAWFQVRGDGTLAILGFQFKTETTSERTNLVATKLRLKAFAKLQTQQGPPPEHSYRTRVQITNGSVKHVATFEVPTSGAQQPSDLRDMRYLTEHASLKRGSGESTDDAAELKRYFAPKK